MKNLFIVLISFLIINEIGAQCLTPITHFSGTNTVNGIDVTVYPYGVVDSNTVYCPGITEPYYIGKNDNDGAFTFDFSQSVDSVLLNFSGMNAVNGHIEVIKIYVNGQHYAIPTEGTPNGCDSLAELTAEGDIIGCTTCPAPGTSGWKGTVIPGPIDFITVFDSVVTGAPNGTIFSIFMCDEITTDITENTLSSVKVYPNPVSDILYVSNFINSNLKISLHNYLGQTVLHQNTYTDSNITINVSGLKRGIYYILIEGEDFIKSQKIVLN